MACPAGTIGENLGSTSIDNCVGCLPGRRAELKPSSECKNRVWFASFPKLRKAFTILSRAGGATTQDRVGSAIARSASVGQFISGHRFFVSGEATSATSLFPQKETFQTFPISKFILAQVPSGKLQQCLWCN